MDLAVQAIPTFGTMAMLTAEGTEGNGVGPNIPMTGTAGMILLSLANPNIGVVGIFGRPHA
jgi:hypothetical protein